MCFSSESFYICKPIGVHLAEVYATGKRDLAPSGSSCCHLWPFLVAPELPMSVVQMLYITSGDCATCMLFGFVVYIYLVLICSHMRVCVCGCIEKQSEPVRWASCAGRTRTAPENAKVCPVFLCGVHWYKQANEKHIVYFSCNFYCFRALLFFFYWYKTTAQRQSLCLLKGDNVIINSGVCWTLLSCRRGLRKLQLRTRSPI